MSLVFVILGAAVLAFYIPEKIRGYTVRAVVLKSVVSLLFIATALSARSGGILAPFVIMGLVLGLCGDIWLDLKYVFPEKDAAFTHVGFAVFAAGHVAYIAGLIIQYGAGLFLIASFALAALAAAAVRIMEKPMKLTYGSMKTIVTVYGFLLFSTVFVSGGCLAARGGTALWIFFIGSVLFAISDLVLSGTYFGTGKDRPMDIILNYLFYYGGQFMIAYSLVFIKA